MTAELLREALARLDFLLDVPSHAIKDGELCWPTLRGEVTVSGQSVITLGRIPLDSANRLADILMRAALHEQTEKATAR